METQESGTGHVRFITRAFPRAFPPQWKAGLTVILTPCCCFYRIFCVRDMASNGLTNREPTGPLPVTLLGRSLDIRSERLYDLVPKIPDVMGLRALRPNAAIVKVMSVRDSQCIRVVTPDDHVE